MKVKEEGKFLSAILDTVGALIVVLNFQGRIVHFTRACEQTTGYSFDEVKGKHVWDVFLIPEEVAAVKAVFTELKAGQFPNKCKSHWLTKDGDCRLISWSNTALLDSNDEVEYIIGTGIDMTETNQAVAALQASEEKFRNLFHHSNDGIFLHDLEG
ncbi:MAG: PAS domain-containing protein, partial [bacterium]